VNLVAPDLGGTCEPVDKRTRILEAALTVFKERGFHEAKVEDISQAAGVGKGTVYEYFRTKNEIYEETVKYHLEKYLKEAREEVQRQATIRDKIRFIIGRQLQILSSGRPISSLLMEDPGPVSAVLKEWVWGQKVSFLITPLTDLIKAGIKTGELRNVDPHVAACHLYAAFHALLALKIVSEGRLENENVVNALTDLLFNGIGNRRRE